MKSLKPRVLILFLSVLFISCEQDVFVEPKSDLPFNTSKVFIDSYPKGAAIYLDGRNTGQVTPDTIRWLTDGNKHFTLKMKYCFDTSFTINAEEHIINNYKVDYSKAYRMLGQINCTSKPSGAKIYIDNVYTGLTTPFEFTHMFPKIYNVKYDYAEYRRDSMNVIVESSKTSTSYVSLEDTLDIITYNAINSKIPRVAVISAVEDKDGNMWFGTEFGGLLKYDGKKFEVFKNKKDYFVLSDYVSRLRKDKNNNLWVGYSNGFAKYDGSNWSLFKTKRTNSMLISRNNEMIAATEGSGVIKYYGEQFITYTSSNSSLQDNNVMSACIDDYGYLWAAPFEKGIDIFDGTSWTHLDADKNKLPYKYVATLDVDKNGTVYGVFYNSNYGEKVAHAVAKYNSGKWTNLWTGLAESDNHEFHFDKNNNIWIGLKGVGLYRIINNKAVSLAQTIHPNLRKFATSYDRIVYAGGRKVYVDSKGNLWILGCSLGLVKIKSGRWD